ncbi:MAG: hypothetical protein V4510_12755 [bacterium]
MPRVLTLLGGPADLQRHVIPDEVGTVFRVPVFYPWQDAMAWSLEDPVLPNLDVAVYSVLQLRSPRGEPVWVGVFSG